MDSTTGLETPKKSPVEGLIEIAKKVIMAPAEFYRGMPKVGGFVDPLIFAVALGVVSGVIQAVLGLCHLGMRLTLGAAVMQIIMMPVFVAIGSFIGAAILFVIWKLMGSGESFETAYRCRSGAGVA